MSKLKYSVLYVLMMLCFVFLSTGCGPSEEENKEYKPLPIATSKDLTSGHYYWRNSNPNFANGRKHISAFHDIAFTEGRNNPWSDVYKVSNFKADRIDDTSFKVKFDTTLFDKRETNEFTLKIIGASSFLLPKQSSVDYCFMTPGNGRRMRDYIEFKSSYSSSDIYLGRQGVPPDDGKLEKIDKDHEIVYYPQFDMALGLYKDVINCITLGERSVFVFTNGYGAWATEDTLKKELGKPVIRERHRFFALNDKKGPECLEITEINKDRYLTLWPSAGCEMYADGKYYSKLKKIVTEFEKSNKVPLAMHRAVDNVFCGFRMGEGLDKQKVVFDNSTKTVSEVKVDTSSIDIEQFFKDYTANKQVLNAIGKFTTNTGELELVRIQLNTNILALEKYLDEKLGEYQIKKTTTYSLEPIYHKKVWSCGDYVVRVDCDYRNMYASGSYPVNIWAINKRNFIDYIDGIYKNVPVK